MSWLGVVHSIYKVWKININMMNCSNWRCQDRRIMLLAESDWICIGFIQGSNSYKIYWVYKRLLSLRRMKRSNSWKSNWQRWRNHLDSWSHIIGRRMYWGMGLYWEMGEVWEMLSFRKHSWRYWGQRGMWKRSLMLWLLILQARWACKLFHGSSLLTISHWHMQQ